MGRLGEHLEFIGPRKDRYVFKGHGVIFGWYNVSHWSPRGKLLSSTLMTAEDGDLWVESLCKQSYKNHQAELHPKADLTGTVVMLTLVMTIIIVAAIFTAIFR